MNSCGPATIRRIVGNLLLCLLFAPPLFSCPLAAADNAMETLVDQLDDPDPIVRIHAVQELADLGTEASAAIPALIRMSASVGDLAPGYGVAFEVQISRALARMAPDSIPALMAALDSDDVRTRALAARALATIGSGVKEAVPRLIELTKAEDFNLKYWSIFALGEVGPDAEAAVPRLIEVFNEEGHAYQDTAAEALEKIGTPQALSETRLHRMKKTVEKALFAPFVLFTWIPGSALAVGFVLVVIYIPLRKRFYSRWSKRLFLVCLSAWLVYGTYETALGLWGMGGEPIRIDLLVIVPTLYLLTLVGMTALILDGFARLRKARASPNRSGQAR